MLDCSRNPPRSRHVVGRFGHGVVTSVLGPGYPYSDPSGPHSVPFCPVGASFCRNRPDLWPRQRPIRLRGTGYRHPSLSPPLPADDLGLALSQHTKIAGADST